MADGHGSGRSSPIRPVWSGNQIRFFFVSPIARFTQRLGQRSIADSTTSHHTTEKTELPTGHRPLENPQESPRRWAFILSALGIFAALSRLINLGHPTDGGTPVFDEKHYVPQAWQILQGWDHLLVGGIEDNPAYGLVVHPPLGKQLSAIGMAVFGYIPFGWRIMTALAAVGVVCLIAMIARRIARSDFVGMCAGLLALVDGILFVTGRSAMLDHFQTFFLLLAVYFLLHDYRQMEQRFATVVRQGRIRDHRFGPRLGFRWWRFGAGVALGCALAVKWSGLYYIAFFGVAIVIIDAYRRRRYGVTAPLCGALVFDAPPHFFNLVGVPVAVYLVSWRAWFASESAVYRHAVESGRFSDATKLHDSVLGLLPDSWVNFLYYHWSVLQFHAELTNSNGHHHDWESKPWSWLASTRGLMYYNPDRDDGMRTVQLLVGTPAIWFPTVVVLAWGLWQLVIHQNIRWSIPVVGFLAGFVPWLANIDRQMYLFYALNLAPFLIIGLALVCGKLLAWSPRVTSNYRAVAFFQRHAGLLVVVGYLTFAVWNFLFFVPIYTGMPLSPMGWASRMWLPSWH